MPREPLAGLAPPVLASALVLALSACGSREPTGPGTDASFDGAASAVPADGSSAFPAAPFSERFDPDEFPQGGASHHPTEILVEVDPDGDWEATFAAHHVEILEEDEDLEYLVVRSAVGLGARPLARALEGEPGVRSAGVDEYVTTPEASGLVISFDDGDHVPGDVADQEALDRLGLAAAHLRATGDDVIVAVLDTGADGSHPLLQEAYRAGWDGVGNDGDPGEERGSEDSDGDGRVDEAWGHGTHVAGLIATIAPEAEILVYRVLNSDGRGRSSRVAQAVKRAARQDADLINLSLGTEAPTRPLEKAIAFARNRGAIVVASVGNRGRAVPVQYPAGYESVLGVGSVDAEDAFSAFSNWGGSLGVCAPGELLLSAAPEGEWAVWTGTSQATAVVTGLVALMRELDPSLEETGARGILGATAGPVFGIPDGADIGRVDLDAATDAIP